MKLEIFGNIKDNKISYSGNYQDKITKFKSKNPDSKIIMTLENIDSPDYYLHKNYRGNLLPDIADVLGEKDKEYVHIFILKKKYLYIDIDSFSDIPEKHRKRAFVFYQELENKRVEVVGYVPSLGDISHDEFKTFTKNCDDFLFVQMDGFMGQSDKNFKNTQEDKINIRDKVIDMFKGELIERN